MIRNKIRHIVVIADENTARQRNSPRNRDIVAFVRENSDAMAQVTIEVLEALEKEEGYEIHNDMLLRSNLYSMH